MKTIGITWSPGPNRSGPPSKDIPQTVDALVDRDLLKKSIKSIFDKQVCPRVDMHVTQYLVYIDTCLIYISEGESGLKRWSGHMMRIFGSIARRYVYSLKIYKQKSQWNPKLVKIRIKSENITIVKYCNSKQ